MRQFQCIELGLQDALTLRDILRPLSPVAPYDQSLMVRMCQKLYGAILKMREERTDDAVNIPLAEHEALFINHFVGTQDWGGAMPLLEQTWLVLYELQHESTYPRSYESTGSVIARMALRPPAGAA